MEHSATTMRAVVQETYGSADELTVAEIALPTIEPDEVQVRVQAAGVDRGTWHLMTGEPRLLRLALGLRGPRQPVPGRDLAGVVVAAGAKTSGFAVGDEVMGVGQGAFAEFSAAKAAKLSRKPSRLTFAQAGALPISGLTAIQALDAAGDLAGRSVLVTGASGGVGHLVVQIAAARGAAVTGVCSAAKADFVRSLGAVGVVDYAQADVTAGANRYDVIIDIAGSASLRRLRRILDPRGTIVFVGSEGGPWTAGIGRAMRAAMRSPFVRQRFVMLASKERAVDIDRLADLVESGEVTPHVHQTYPLGSAAQALRDLEAGTPQGKLVIDFDS